MSNIKRVYKRKKTGDSLENFPKVRCVQAIKSEPLLNPFFYNQQNWSNSIIRILRHHINTYGIGDVQDIIDMQGNEKLFFQKVVGGDRFL